MYINIYIKYIDCVAETLVFSATHINEYSLKK